MTMPLSYSIVDDGNSATLCVLDLTTGESGNVTQWNSYNKDIQDAVMEIINDPEGYDDPISEIYLTIIGTAQEKIDAIREELGVTINDNGDVVIGDAVLPHRFQDLLSTVDTRQEAESIVAFAHDLLDNPGEHSREALIEWLLANPSLSFTNDGRIIGYRALRDDFTSNHHGYGIVNGKEYANAHLDNSPGNVLEFPRFMTDANPGARCSIGLHVGTWRYATNYLGYDSVRVSVAFRASDVVSPPSDAQQEKIRVSKFTVLQQVFSPYEDTVMDTDSISVKNNQ